MLKRMIVIPALLMAMLIVLPAEAQERDNSKARVSPNAMVEQTIGTTTVSISYSRPAVKDRELWGGLVPFGKIWRTGANEATTFTTSGDIKVEGEMLPAGTYSLFAIPAENEWTWIFNKVANQWGAFNHDEAQDALRVKVKPMEAPHKEWLAYGFKDLSADSAVAYLHWGNWAVPFTISQ